jgi:hypothetical protein
MQMGPKVNVSADGPGLVMANAGRSNGETSVNLVRKIPAAAAKADVMPSVREQPRLQITTNLCINRLSNRAFGGARNRLWDGLKNYQKTLFLQ